MPELFFQQSKFWFPNVLYRPSIFAVLQRNCIEFANGNAAAHLGTLLQTLRVFWKFKLDKRLCETSSSLKLGMNWKVCVFCILCQCSITFCQNMLLRQRDKNISPRYLDEQTYFAHVNQALASSTSNIRDCFQTEVLAFT